MSNKPTKKVALYCRVSTADQKTDMQLSDLRKYTRERNFTIISAMSQLERDIIKERVKGGLRKALENGKTLGRPQVTVNHAQAKKMRLNDLSVRQIANKLNISKSVIGRLLNSCPNNLVELAG